MAAEHDLQNALRITALTNLVHALVATHPDPEKLLEAYRSIEAHTITQPGFMGRPELVEEMRAFLRPLLARLPEGPRTQP